MTHEELDLYLSQVLSYNTKIQLLGYISMKGNDGLFELLETSNKKILNVLGKNIKRKKVNKTYDEIMNETNRWFFEAECKRYFDNIPIKNTIKEIALKTGYVSSTISNRFSRYRKEICENNICSKCKASVKHEWNIESEPDCWVMEYKVCEYKFTIKRNFKI